MTTFARMAAAEWCDLLVRRRRELYAFFAHLPDQDLVRFLIRDRLRENIHATTADVAERLKRAGFERAA